ncbi:ABC transporter substrate-binding protein [Streptomyces sp. LX-29]|uniref:ABC transporter substrate-binding protein n=1 Tax=Streptomyces sp. LX-29 TaxID=2900152 RepID=UPI00240D3E49|nr:ABC transporter substrate-binding protein [Streptomyces sp. LX-29]WFB07586.1 ABC transporter substrate-binding protein [Streptomyces sp. LX-29]
MTSDPSTPRGPRRARRGARPAAAALAAAVLTLSACSSGGGGGDPDDDPSRKTDKNRAENYSLGTKADSTGPAAPVPGAKEGGTVNVLQRDAFTHLDPAQIYYADQLSVQMLYNRSLTTYKIDANGRVKVVGDLATDTGTSSDGGRTWTYTLKDGLKFEDGSPITSADVRQSVERLYAKFATDGPQYIPQWLSGEGQSFRKALPDGPYKGDHLPDDVLDTPDDKTVVFHFREPHADTPYAVAMPNIGAVPAEPGKDTKERYDTHPVASGPYKIGTLKAGKSLTLVRNEHWDPRTDPVRHQYPERFAVSFGVQEPDSARRLLAERGGDRQAMSFTNAVTIEAGPSVLKDDATKDRTFNEVQPYVDYMAINMDRIKDRKVRQALAYALPNHQILGQLGGARAGQVAGNLLSPSLAGWKDIDPYGKKKFPAGDTATAKRLLREAGKEGQEIVYAYPNTTEYQKISVVVTQALEKAGFQVEKKEIDSNNYTTEISKVDNGFDIYRASWGADWPVGSTVVPPLFDGRSVVDGSQNYWHLRNGLVNAEIDRINKITDVEAAADEWVKLAEKILTEDVPAVPIFYNRQWSIWGSGIGGVKYHPVYGTAAPTDVYVK